MALREGMNTYAWNEYYLILAAAILTVLQTELIAMATGDGDVTYLGLITAGVKLLTVATVTTLAFIREPYRR